MFASGNDFKPKQHNWKAAMLQPIPTSNFKWIQIKYLPSKSSLKKHS